MARKKKNRKITIAQLKAKLENFKERDMILLQRALGRWSTRKMTRRNRKRLKDHKNNWRREYE